MMLKHFNLDNYLFGVGVGVDGVSPNGQRVVSDKDSPRDGGDFMDTLSRVA